MPLPDPPALAGPLAARAASAAAGRDLAPGTVLDGRYVIEREIARGGMGRVFTARDGKLGREIAVKVVQADDAEPAQLERLAREARTAGSLAHPNIVAIHDLVTHAGQPCLVEELLHGETLRDRLLHGPLPPERAIDLAVQLSRGLAAAHAQGIVHRDVKPDNLFVTVDGALKILDFGIATLRPASAGPHTWTTGLGAAAGTPGYMSPEQVQGRAADARSDLFSFGLVLHEMLSGRPAFERDTAFEAAWAVVHEPPSPLPPAIPLPLQRIVRRCLEKDPAARYQSTRDLTFDLEALQTGAPRLDRLSRRVALLAATGLALALIGIAALLVLRRARPAIEFRQLTFHRGAVWAARFAPDGKTVFYAVTGGAGLPELHATRVDRPESRQLDAPPANLLAVSSSGSWRSCCGPRSAGTDTIAARSRGWSPTAAPRASWPTAPRPPIGTPPAAASCWCGRWPRERGSSSRSAACSSRPAAGSARRASRPTAGRSPSSTIRIRPTRWGR